MRIHEYQAKRLLKSYGVPIPRGALAFTPAEAEAAARFLGGSGWAVKAQIHAGDRGRAGAVALVGDLPAVREAAVALFGRRVTTPRTGARGAVVRRLYIEEAYRPARELYLAACIDRASGRVALLGAPHGGINVEDTAKQRPETVTKLLIDSRRGLQADEVRSFVTRLEPKPSAVDAVASVAKGLYRALVELDASLVEVNPLIVLDDDRVMALDARMVLDDNALFRHSELAALRDEEDRAAIELEAARHEINYVVMDGNVGCVANGAGLGMATVDLLKSRGVEPANFMDIRPVATREQIAAGFRMILTNPNLACILINIFGGGIMRCDLVAEAMVLATREVPVRAPVVVRFAGTNAELGRKLLENSALTAEFAFDLADAAARVARIVRLGGGPSRRSSVAARWF